MADPFERSANLMVGVFECVTPREIQRMRSGSERAAVLLELGVEGVNGNPEHVHEC